MDAKIFMETLFTVLVSMVGSRFDAVGRWKLARIFVVVVSMVLQRIFHGMFASLQHNNHVLFNVVWIGCII